MNSVNHGEEAFWKAIFSFRQKVFADFCLRRQGQENIGLKNTRRICLIRTYTAGNSMQQYFPRVRCETINGLTCLILDGREQIR